MLLLGYVGRAQDRVESGVLDLVELERVSDSSDNAVRVPATEAVAGDGVVGFSQDG